MKKFGIVLLLFVLLFSLVSVHATAPRLVDDADLLTDEEEAEITGLLDAVSARYDVDVVIVTVWSLDGKSAMAYADDYYDYHDYAENGILFLIAMESRDYWFSTKGSCKRAFTDAGIDYLGDQIQPHLSEEDYARAFRTFADKADDFLNQARTGTPYDIDSLPKEPLGWFAYGICAVIAFIFGLIVIGSMKKKMKSVAYQRAASQYVVPGSLNVKLSQDIYLYHIITRVARPKESSSSGGGSSTHTSSSGSSHGGGGGKF